MVITRSNGSSSAYYGQSKTKIMKKPKLKTIRLYSKKRRHPTLRRCLSGQSSGNIFLPNLPFDIQLNIISRLHAKLIIGCKSLSKAFNQSISESTFTDMYRHFSNFSSTYSSLLHPIFINCSNITSIYEGESFDISLDLVQFDTDIYTNNNNVDPIITKGRCFNSGRLPESSLRRKGIHKRGSSIWGQCNGLFCFLKIDLDFLNLFVVNPILGEFIKLPDPVVYGNIDDWRKTMMAYGLGHCQLTDKFKVLRMITSYLGGTNYENKTQILTIGVDKEWRSVSDANVPYNINAGFCGSNPQLYMVSFRSALHWIVQPVKMDNQNNIEPKCGGQIHIAAFDMTEEKVCALPFPPEVDTPDYYGMGVLMDKLCLWDLMIETDDIDIWVMDEYGVEGYWTKTFTIKFSRLPRHFEQEELIILTISLHDQIILISDHRKLVFYDLKTNNSLMQIHLISDPEYDLSYPMPFIPDFVSFRNRQGWIAA